MCAEFENDIMFMGRVYSLEKRAGLVEADLSLPFQIGCRICSSFEKILKELVICVFVAFLYILGWTLGVQNRM